jgi:hypothetical protein
MNGRERRTRVRAEHIDGTRRALREASTLRTKSGAEQVSVQFVSRHVGWKRCSTWLLADARRRRRRTATTSHATMQAITVRARPLHRPPLTFVGPASSGAPASLIPMRAEPGRAGHATAGPARGAIITRPRRPALLALIDAVRRRAARSGTGGRLLARPTGSPRAVPSAIGSSEPDFSRALLAVPGSFSIFPKAPVRVLSRAAAALDRLLRLGGRARARASTHGGRGCCCCYPEPIRSQSR